MLELIIPHLTVPKILLFLLSLHILSRWTTYIIESIRIHKLGSKAPLRTTYLPYGIDMVASTLNQAVKQKNYELWINMFRKYGRGGYTIEANLVRRIVLTADPDNVKAILATQFKDFGKGEEFNRDWFAFLGNGIFATDGQLWHDSRQLIRPQFIKDRLSDIDIFEEHLQSLMPMMSNCETTDMLDMFMRFTLDASTHFLLGRSVDSIHTPAVEFAGAFAHAQHWQSLISRAGPLNFVIPRQWSGFNDSIQKINNFIYPYIEEALRLSPEKLTSSHDGEYNFLHAIAGYTRDKKVLRDQLLSVLLAGRDTTACTLTWTIYHLSMEPRIVERLRQEIGEKVGWEKKPTYDDLKGMKYLQHIMNETLRLYPVVPFNVRFALKDTTLPTGGGRDGKSPIGILAGTPVAYSPLFLQRRTDLYPPPSSGFPAIDKFVPERWDGWTPKSWTYIPFNGGPRICIGQQFALTEMAYTLVRLFQRFESVENVMGGVEPGLHCDIVLQPVKPIRVVFREARKV